MPTLQVRDHRPLQQGLRPIEVFEKDLQEVRVRDHRPLQQGVISV